MCCRIVPYWKWLVRRDFSRTQSRRQDMALLLVISMHLMIAGKHIQQLLVLKAACARLCRTVQLH